MAQRSVPQLQPEWGLKKRSMTLMSSHRFLTNPHYSLRQRVGIEKAK